MKSLEQRLLLTLAYTAQFSYPLTTKEWLERSIGTNRFSKHEFLNSITALVTGGHVCYSNGFWCIPGKESDSAVRERRMTATQQKFVELTVLTTFLRKIPWVIGVAITGSAAMNNAEADDDIDILIVTQNNRLWLVRPLVILFAFLRGKRRTWSSEEKNSWCFNLWLERSSLSQPTTSHSIYVAYEVCQTKWVIDRAGTQAAFYSLNSWVNRYIPYYFKSISSAKNVREVVKSPIYVPLISEILTVSNYCWYIAQRLYMHRHMTRERVAYSYAFFHPRDTRTVISEGLRDIVDKLTQYR
jgi:predicted nucleotidyltransferase